MARVTIDDCLDKVDNRFVLVVAAAKRARQLHNGAKSHTGVHNKEVVVSLREIASGEVYVPSKETA